MALSTQTRIGRTMGESSGETDRSAATDYVAKQELKPIANLPLITRRVIP
jgi:hypothetical protein